ncbi:MAG: sialidase family protein [Thermoplasmatota archaeon]
MSQIEKGTMGARAIIILVFLILLLSGIFDYSVISGNGLNFNSNDYPVRDNIEQKNCDIASNSNGNTTEVYIVYEDYAIRNDAHVHFKRSLDGGRNWQNPIDFISFISAAGDRHISPVIDVYSNGSTRTIAVAYLDSTLREYQNVMEWVIVVRISSDGGFTWEPPRYVTPLGSIYTNDHIKDPSMAFDPNGNIFVTWTNMDGDDRINLAYSTDLGKNWSKILVLPDNVETNIAQNYNHKLSSVASDGSYVYVAWNDESTWREFSWISRAPTSSISEYPMLAFSDPQRIARSMPYDYQTYLPQLEADRNGVHLVWWDFSTDSNGADNKDINMDRPSVKYTHSFDNGATWEVNGSQEIIINSSSPDAWHSAPDLSLGPDGRLGIAWMDHTMGHPNIFASISNDNGSTWSNPARANEHHPERYREKPRVVVDQAECLHVIWTEREDQNSDNDFVHSGSIENVAPPRVDDLHVILTDERMAIIGWTPTRIPDFKGYEIHIGMSENFAISESYWPFGTLYNISTDQLKHLEFFRRDMEPDTMYSAKLVIEDQDGLISISNEIAFRTRPVNMCPSFRRDIPTIDMFEDTSLVPALNLSAWIQNDWIIDDHYNGHDILEFDVECTSSDEPNLTATIRNIGSYPFYSYLDIFTSRHNWFGTETFRISVTDAGKDGALGSKDDMTGHSNEFAIKVNSINDIPVWGFFQDLATKMMMKIPSQSSEFALSIEEIGCVQGQEYSFALTADDIDGDFVDFRVKGGDEDRFVIEKDPFEPHRKSIFTFIPLNSDVPITNITISVDDGKGGKRELTLHLPVENVNDAPYFTSVNGDPVLPSGGRLFFEIEEYGPNSSISLSVEANDIDPKEELTLLSMSKRPRIEMTGKTNWTVFISALPEDAVIGYFDFTLELLDKLKTSISTLDLHIEVRNIPDSPSWLEGREKVSVRYIYDETDMNEWNLPKDPAPEWNEDIRFEGFAYDPDNDTLTYIWRFTNENSQRSFSRTGKVVDVKFLPSDGNLSRIQTEKMQINLTVSDGDDSTPDIYFYRELWISPDHDNDNDGMPDTRELYFWGNLDQEPDVDYDGDGYTNIEEIGFHFPLMDTEKGFPYYIDRRVMDPTSKFPWYDDDDDDDDIVEEKNDIHLPFWYSLIMIAVVFFLLSILSGSIIIYRVQKRREIEEENEVEMKISDMGHRQKEIRDLYGGSFLAGDDFGPDQSTLDDLELDHGEQIYHENISTDTSKYVEFEDFGD